ncbi:MAG: DJ-1/PfpI family protein [Halobacteriaceae archaeon]
MDGRDIAVLLYDGFDELDAVGPYETFRNAGLDATTRTLDDRERVEGSHGLTVAPDGRLADADPDLLLVPGGGWNARAEAGAWAEVERGDLPRAVRDAHDAGVTVASVCTGGMVLAAAGVLDGRPAVTHHGALGDLREYDVDVVDARVVDDGDVLTAGGVTAGLDLALHVVSEVRGDDVAREVADGMEYRRVGDVYRGEGAGRD